MPVSNSDILDQVAWASLAGRHAIFAEGGDKARRYQTDVSPFAALEPDADAGSWAQLAALVGAGRVVTLVGASNPPDGWTEVGNIPGVQLIATDGFRTEPLPEALVLGDDDVDEMLDLVGRTRPGPFLRRTNHLGRYIGVRRDGALIAMAGERTQPPGFTEISAVCTDPAYQRQGLAAALVRDVAHVIRDRGETPFMHASATNENAIRLYLSMGFALRRTVTFTSFRTPV
ncbi:MAG: hypothetical protein JWN20_2064 [Jatrophihabitantaceae bacterium]|nr:hypothetical protein [Jatrophihabitantaceae bacterium]